MWIYCAFSCIRLTFHKSSYLFQQPAMRILLRRHHHFPPTNSFHCEKFLIVILLSILPSFSVNSKRQKWKKSGKKWIKLVTCSLFIVYFTILIHNRFHSTRFFLLLISWCRLHRLRLPQVPMILLLFFFNALFLSPLQSGRMWFLQIIEGSGNYFCRCLLKPSSIV